MQATGARFATRLAQAQDATHCWREQPARVQALLWSLRWQLAGAQALRAEEGEGPAVEGAGVAVLAD